MAINKIIDAAGKSFMIPIDDNDQSVSIGITGSYSGLLQIVGIIDASGREIELTPRLIDGTIVSIEDPPPLDLMFDIAGYREIRVIAITWTSGSITLTANRTMAAAAWRLNGGSRGSASGQVEVTNFPSPQSVTGPLTNTQLRASPLELPDNAAQNDTLQTLISQMAVRLTGVDSDGVPLPLDFDSVPVTFSYDGELVQTEIRVIGSSTYTRTYGNNGTNITSVSSWIKT